jgi:hypothetical protein
MNIAESLHDPKEKPYKNTGPLGIAVQIGPGTKHVGILFRRTVGRRVGELQLLHLANHHDVRCSAPTNRCAWTRLEIDPIREALVAQLCELLEEEYINNPTATRSKLGYAFHYRGETFDPTSGIFVTKDGYGLTCATFVLAVFASYGVYLLHLSSWESRPEDVEWQRQVIAYMKRESIDPKHIKFIEEEVGCCRFRPEEVAAAGTVDALNLPLGFHDAAYRGQAIVRELFRRATSAA